MDELVKQLLVSGISGLVASVLILLVAKPLVQRAIEHWFGKIEERVRIEGVLIEKRYTSSANALKDLTELYEDLQRELRELNFTEEESRNPLSKIVQESHPRYRARFHIIRSQLEVANDLLSFYSIEFERLLHADVIQKIIGTETTNVSDCKYAYRTIWRAAPTNLHAVLRIAAAYEFWDSGNQYADRARKWAEADGRRIEEFLIMEIKRIPSENKVFSLYLEEYGAKEFWKHLDPSLVK